MKYEIPELGFDFDMESFFTTKRKPTFVIFVILAIVMYHTRHQFFGYHRKFHKRRAYLYLHVFTSLTEVFRYRLREVTSEGPIDILPDAFGVLSAFVWAWTSLELVKTLRRGDPQTTRPPYQAGACLRPVISLASYLFGIPCLHKVSISALDSFIWARVGIFFLTYSPYMKSPSSKTAYAIAIPLSAVIAIHESRVPGASTVYIIAMACVAGLNKWVTQKSRSLREYANPSALFHVCNMCLTTSNSPSESSQVPLHVKWLIPTLIDFGFVELEELRVVSKLNALEKPVQDEYI